LGIAEVFGVALQVAVVVGSRGMRAEVVEIEVAGVEAPVGAGDEEQVGGGVAVAGGFVAFGELQAAVVGFGVFEIVAAEVGVDGAVGPVLNGGGWAAGGIANVGGDGGGFGGGVGGGALEIGGAVGGVIGGGDDSARRIFFGEQRAGQIIGVRECKVRALPVLCGARNTAERIVGGVVDIRGVRAAGGDRSETPEKILSCRAGGWRSVVGVGDWRGTVGVDVDGGAVRRFAQPCWSVGVSKAVGAKQFVGGSGEPLTQVFG